MALFVTHKQGVWGSVAYSMAFQAPNTGQGTINASRILTNYFFYQFKFGLNQKQKKVMSDNWVSSVVMRRAVDMKIRGWSPAHGSSRIAG